MKRFYPFRLVVFTLITTGLLFLTMSSNSSQAVSLGVETASICRDVVSRTPFNGGNSFPVSLGKLYCFTKIVDVPGPTEVTHVWYYGDTERARVTLSVDFPTWRTYSSKIIQPHETGEWHVDVLGPSGDRLISVPFEITP